MGVTSIKTGDRFGESHSLGTNLGLHASFSWIAAQERAEEQGWLDHAVAPHFPQRGFGSAGPQGPSPLHAGTQRVFPGKPQHPNHVLPATPL